MNTIYNIYKSHIKYMDMMFCTKCVIQNIINAKFKRKDHIKTLNYNFIMECLFINVFEHYYLTAL